MPLTPCEKRGVAGEIEKRGEFGMVFLIYFELRYISKNKIMIILSHHIHYIMRGLKI